MQKPKIIFPKGNGRRLNSKWLNAVAAAAVAVAVAVAAVAVAAVAVAAAVAAAAAAQLWAALSSTAQLHCEQRFSFFFDFPGTTLLESVKSEAHEVIFERITQDIFNASLADW